MAIAENFQNQASVAMFLNTRLMLKRTNINPAFGKNRVSYIYDDIAGFRVFVLVDQI